MGYGEVGDGGVKGWKMGYEEVGDEGTRDIVLRT